MLSSLLQLWSIWNTLHFNFLIYLVRVRVPKYPVLMCTTYTHWKKYLIVNHFISHFTCAEFSLESVCFCFFVSTVMHVWMHSVVSVCVYTAKRMVLWEQVFAAECKNWKWQCLSFDTKHSIYYYTVRSQNWLCENGARVSSGCALCSSM